MVQKRKLNGKKRKKKIRRRRLKNKKYEDIVKKYFSRKYLFVGLVLLIILLIFKNQIVGIGLIAIFIPMSKYTVRVTRFVNYITFETYTASAILFAYMYGSFAGGLGGLLLGLYGYLSNSVTKFLALLNVVVTSIMGFIMGNFADSFNFSSFFIISIVVNNVIAFCLFLVFDPDKVQNYSYRTTHLIWNIFVVRLFFIIIHNIVSTLA